MPYIPRSNEVLTDSNRTVQSFEFSQEHYFSALNPGTKYRIFMNDIDVSWAAKQYGKDLGDTLIADSNGNLRFRLLTEQPFESPFFSENNQISYSAQQNTNLNKQETKRKTKLFEDPIVLQLKDFAGNVKASVTRSMRVLQIESNPCVSQLPAPI